MEINKLAIALLNMNNIKFELEMQNLTINWFQIFHPLLTSVVEVCSWVWTII